MSPGDRVVAVVGGGITGLAAAHYLLPSGAADAEAPGPDGQPRSAPPPRLGGRPPKVVVMEAGDRLGGKIATREMSGLALEAGPDAFVVGSGHALALCEALGLTDQLVSPATGRAYILVSGKLRPLPPGLVLGVPTSLTALDSLRRVGLISRRAVARGALDLVLPRRTPMDDVASVAMIVGRRFGTEVLSRVVSPLVGGINAGDTRRLSAAAVTPQLLAAARSHRSLMRGLQAAAASPGAPTGAEGSSSASPVSAPLAGGRPRQGFFSLAGGLSVLVDRLAEAIQCRHGELWTAAPVDALARHGDRWRLGLGDGRQVEADAVVLAVPAFSAADLLEPHAQELAGLLRSIPYASVTLVSLTYPERSVAHRLDGAGFLVSPATSALRRRAGAAPLLTACTWTTSKWPRSKRPGEVVLRASTGRFGDDRALQMTDDALVGAVHEELAPVLGLSAPPSEARVHRWPASFPQYLIGHLSTVSRIEEAVTRLPGVALAGAAYRGLGIPACIAQGQEAARKVTAGLGALVAG